MAERKRSSSPVADTVAGEGSVVNVSAVADLRGVSIKDLPQRVQQSRVASSSSQLDGDAEETQSMNPRVARALGLGRSAADELPLPPIPEPLTEQSAYAWLAEVVGGMHPASSYRKKLIDVLRRNAHLNQKEEVKS